MDSLAHQSTSDQAVKTEMDSEEFLSQLQTICSDAIEIYRQQYSDGLRLTEEHSNALDGPPATDADIHDSFTVLTRFYDDLFDVDSTPYREEWREQLVYDCSRRERLSMLTSNLPRSLTNVLIEARYVPDPGYIGVSDSQLPAAAADSYLASELCHAYQHTLDSPTWDHPYLCEGFEQAASVRAVEHLANERETDSLIYLATRQWAEALLQGVLAHGTRQDDITPAAVRELGLTDEEMADIQSHRLWRPLGRLRPHHYWDTTAYLPEYALFGSLLLVSDELGVSDSYARAFRGDHPWETLVDDFRSVTPGRLWQWYHS